MKTTILKQLTAFAAALVAFSCIDSNTPGEGEQKYGNFKIPPVGVVEDLREKNSGQMATRAVSPETFEVIITRLDTGVEVHRSAYAQMPASLPLLVGDYTLVVQSHALQDAEWDKIHYALSHQFTIVENQTYAPENLVCTVTNILVSTNFSGRMRDAMGEGCTLSVKIGNCGPLVYGKNETRMGAFRAEVENNTLVWDFAGTIDGIEVSETGTIRNVRAGEHRILNFDAVVIERGHGSFAVAVSVDSEVYDINLNVDLDDEQIIEPFAHPLEIEASHSLVERSTIDLAATAPAALGFDIVATAGIRALTLELTTDNTALDNTLQQQGFAGVIDLVNPTAQQQTMLDNLGLPTAAAVEGATGLNISFLGLLPMLGMFDAVDVFDIKLTVADNADQSQTATMPLKFIKTQQGVISIVGDGFDIDQRMVIPASAQDSTPVKVNIAAPQGIEQLIVEISSTSDNFNAALAMMGFNVPFDLAHPGEMAGDLTDLGLSNGDQVLGKTSLEFDITSFVPLLFTVGAGSDFDADFKLTVVDAGGDSLTKTIKLQLIN